MKRFPSEPPATEQVPPRVKVAFQALHYCRSVSDPTSVGLPAYESQPRPLTPMERGVETAALNLVRNFLNGEIDFATEAPAQLEHSETPETQSSKVRLRKMPGDGPLTDDGGPTGEAEA